MAFFNAQEDIWNPNNGTDMFGSTASTPKPAQPTFSWDNQYQSEQAWKPYTPPTGVGQNFNFDFGNAFSNFGSYGAPSGAPLGSGSSPLFEDGIIKSVGKEQQALPDVAYATAPTGAGSTTTTTPAATQPTNTYANPYANYLYSQPDLTDLWNMGDGNRGQFNGLTDPAQAGQQHWLQYGQFEDRSYDPTNPNPTPETPTVVTPAGPTDAEKAATTLAKIKDLYTTVSGYGKGTNLNDLILKQTERDNLLRELDGYKVADASAMGKSYGSLIDNSVNDIRGAQDAAKSYYQTFLTNFGADAWAQARNSPLSTNWQMALDRLDAADNGFDTYGFMGDQLSQATAARDQLKAALEQQLAAANTERQRITGFETSAQGKIRSLIGELDAMDINGFDTNSTAYRQKIRDIEAELRGFSGQLPFDLNDELSLLGSANSRYADLQGQRDKEVARIQSSMGALGSQGDALASMLSKLDGYNGAGMQQVEAELARLKKNAAAFDSPLAKKYGPQDLAGIFSQIESGLGGLKTQNATYVAKELGDANALKGRLGGIQEWDEDGMNALQNLLYGESQNLSRFTGNSVDPIRALLEEISTGLTDRRTALTTRRGGIEQELADLLSANTGKKYATLDEVAAQRAALNGKSSDMRKYRAVQAQDELDALLQLFNGEENRINADLKTAQDRDAAQAKATQVQVNRWGNLLAPGAGVAQDPFSAAQLAAIMRKRQVDSRLAPYSAPDYTTFSQALGV